MSQSPRRQSDSEGTEALPPVPRDAPLAVRVRVTRGKASPMQFRLSAGSCRVGAGADSDLVVEDRTVSRAHLELRLVPEGVRVLDLGSRNGSFYLGQRVTEIILAPSSRLTLGSTELAIEPDLAELESARADGPSRYDALVGSAPAMRRLFAWMQRLEGSLVNVLIEGESGTGKELIARALHENSSLSEKPFIALNCGALDRALARSELFGHKKGAFTGAISDSNGAFQAADGGTLFLDEVGELPLEIQPLLLRVLESARCARVGDTEERPVKVRLIAATNRALKAAVEAGQFREDLYYRLMVVKLEVPPLRERPEDVPRLIQHLSQQLGLDPLPPDAVSELCTRNWPGNVRELKNALLAYGAVGSLDQGSARGSSEGQLDAALREALDLERPYADQKEALIERMTRIYLQMLLEHTGGNRSEAARVAGLQRGYLRKLIEKLGLED